MSAAREVRLGLGQQALKAATRALIGAAGGTDAAGATCHARQQRMSDCQLRNTADFLRIDEVTELEDVTFGSPGWPQVTSALCRRQGGMFVRMPDARPRSPDYHQAMGDVSREASEVIEEFCRALANGVVSDEELRKLGIRDRIADAQKGLAVLDALVERQLGEDSS